MEDLRVLCNSTASIYELPPPPMPVTPQLDEVGSQSSKALDLDAEGYIHHFRDSSPRKVVSLQENRSNTTVINATSDDVINKPHPRRNTDFNGSGSESDAECYTVSSKGAFNDASKNPAMIRPCQNLSSKEFLSNDSFKKAGSIVDYAAMRSIVQAPPDPTIWGNKMMTIASTRFQSNDTKDDKAAQGISITDSQIPGPVCCTASRSSTPHNAYDVGDCNTANELDVTDAHWADPLTEIPSNGFTSDAAGLATRAWVNGHYGAAEGNDTSAVSGRHGTNNHHGTLSIQDKSHTIKVCLDRNQGDQYFDSSDDPNQHEPSKATQKPGMSSGEPNMQQRSTLSNSQDTDHDSLLAVSLGCLFKTFGSMLRSTQSLYHEICHLQHALQDMKSRARAAEQQLSENQNKMVGTYHAS